LLNSPSKNLDIDLSPSKAEAGREAKKSTLDEILAPTRRQFAESGLSEDDLTNLVREERRAIQMKNAEQIEKATNDDRERR
jgi:hypothetical protein